LTFPYPCNCTQIEETAEEEEARLERFAKALESEGDASKKNVEPVKDS
jgi:hypothetical protein